MLNLKNDKFEYDPYPFGYFNQIFDQDFYNSLCDEFPNVNELKASDGMIYSKSILRIKP